MWRIFFHHPSVHCCFSLFSFTHVGLNADLLMFHHSRYIWLISKSRRDGRAFCYQRITHRLYLWGWAVVFDRAYSYGIASRTMCILFLHCLFVVISDPQPGEADSWPPQVWICCFSFICLNCCLMLAQAGGASKWLFYESVLHHFNWDYELELTEIWIGSQIGMHRIIHKWNCIVLKSEYKLNWIIL